MTMHLINDDALMINDDALVINDDALINDDVLMIHYEKKPATAYSDM